MTLQVCNWNTKREHNALEDFTPWNNKKWKKNITFVREKSCFSKQISISQKWWGVIHNYDYDLSLHSIKKRITVKKYLRVF